MADNKIRPLLCRPEAAIMGIINATPDSFSDGGQFNSLNGAVQQGMALVDEGADILDVGGESTRPGAADVGLQEELDRVIPLIEALVSRTEVPISIDTYKPEVMLEATKVGAQMVNDVNGLRADGALETVAQIQVPVCIMHMQGKPKDMQTEPKYSDVVGEVIAFYQDRIAACVGVGINQADIILDPGIGFGKSLNHNLLLLNNIERMALESDCELLVGVSRKSLIEKQLNRPLYERLPASLGLAVQSVLNGAKIVRVHDVRATVDAIRMVEAVRDAK